MSKASGDTPVTVQLTKDQCQALTGILVQFAANPKVQQDLVEMIADVITRLHIAVGAADYTASHQLPKNA
jgi:hypothetical protein